jgi:SAM-dependent methyltransferase
VSSTRELYDPAFYTAIVDGARRSAREVVPLVLGFVRCRRVIDLGCGLGTWLSVFLEHGVEDVVGVDGDHVDPDRLEIPRDRFVAHDLTRPLGLDQSFDLALSLEVAEHLAPEVAGAFVGSLIGLAPVVLFSAAIPFQGGTHHVNEQWPEYWAERFAVHGYVPVDCLRRRIWRNPNVEWWYCQNLLVFASPPALERHPALGREWREQSDRLPLPVVHPRKYLELCYAWPTPAASEEEPRA